MNISKVFWLSMVVLILVGCASNKRKKSGEVSALSKFYHNTTAYYNGYFNADEILDITYERLEEDHKDDYTEVVSMYSYDMASDVKGVTPDLDKAIEKVVRVANLHQPSDYVDDCYVLMAEAQYLKRDYETAEETLRFFEAEFNPSNTSGRQYKVKETRKSKRKAKERDRKLKLKEREAARKKKQKEKEAAKKEKEELRKQKEKEKKAKRRAKQKERKAREKARKKAKKRKRKSGKKRSKKRSTRKKAEDATKKVEDTAKKVSDKVDETIKKVNEIKLEENDGDVEGRLGRDTDKPEEEEETAPETRTVSQKDKTSYSKGLVWLARTYVARDNYSAAESVLTRLQNNGVSNDEVLREIPVVLGDIRIKQKRYAEAIPYVEQAYELAKDKKLKARYAYVLGQLHSKANSYNKAGTYFAEAEKKARKFEMRFAARLNALKNEMLSGSRTQEATVDILERMIKEDKNIDQRDQIHMTKADIYLNLDKTDEAIKSYQDAIAASTSNTNLKLIAYKELGELYYDRELYIPAKNYLDSVVIVAGESDIHGVKAKRTSDQLIEIVKNIRIINDNDSLLRLAKMPDSELRALAKKIVDARVADANIEEEKKGSFSSTKSVFGKSSFPFYNPQTAEKGKKDFNEKWGERKLVDNWRVSSISSDTSFDSEVDEEESADSGADAQVEAELRRIKGRIPYSGEKKTSTNRAIETAMYILGSKYRTNIQNLKKSMETHQELLRRYPDTQYKLDAYYYIYLNAQELNEVTTNQKYKELILRDFPDSEYAKYISDPRYLEEKNNENTSVETYYQETYAAYEKGAYQEVSDRASKATKLYGEDNSLKVKFDLLNTLAIGNLRGKEVYINGLKNFISKYPDTPEQVRASEILRFLEGDDSAFESKVKGAKAEYVYEDGLHYLILVAYEPSDRDLTKMRIKISSYNKKFHRSKKLKIEEKILNMDEKTFVIIVRNFKSIDQGMKYYDEIIKDMDDYAGKTSFIKTPFLINQANYRKLLSEKSDIDYHSFFQSKYVR